MTEFVSGISIVCFAASYAVALACEASRPVFRSSLRSAAMIGFAVAGLVAHTLYLVWRGVSESGVPLSSPQDWYLLAAWLLAAGSLWLTLTNPRTPVGLFLLPVVLALVGAAWVASDDPFLQTPDSRVWVWIHVSFLLAASVSVAVGAVAGLMWLIQAGRLARKEAPPRGFRMPSLERLTHLTHRSLAVAAWTSAAGVVLGVVLNAVNWRQGLLETVPWTDPVMLRMGALVAWLVAADALSHAVKRRPDGGRITAWMSLASLAVLAVSLAWGFLGASRHGSRSATSPEATVAPSEAAP